MRGKRGETRYWESCYRKHQKEKGKHDRHSLFLLGMVAWCLSRERNYNKAVRKCRQRLRRSRSALGEKDRDTVFAYHSLVDISVRQGRWDEETILLGVRCLLLELETEADTILISVTQDNLKKLMDRRDRHT